VKRGAQSSSSRRGKRASMGEKIPLRSRKLRDVMVIAGKQGLLRGERTQVVRGRMPEALVTKAKKRTGIDSDTDLIEVALANIAVADDYADWLLSQRGALGSEAELEFCWPAPPRLGLCRNQFRCFFCSGHEGFRHSSSDHLGPFAAQ
jgi:hypothetical protein